MYCIKVVFIVSFVRPAAIGGYLIRPAKSKRLPTSGLSLALKIHSRRSKKLENCFGESKNDIDSNIRYRAEWCRIMK